MGIKALFEAFNQQVTEIMGGLQATLPTIKLSANSLSDLDSAPRIVMVPTRGTIADSIGQAGFGDGIAVPLALKARKLRFEFHIWGRDFDDCEALMNHTAAAIHALGWGGDNAVAEDWTKGAASNAKSGVLVVLSIDIEMPLVREMPTQAVIESFPEAGVIQAPA